MQNLIICSIIKQKGLVMNKKIIVWTLAVFLLIFVGFKFYNYHISNLKLEKHNICQDNELIGELIVENVNPFSKFKFIKKRNSDCKVLLIENKDLAFNEQKTELCSILDDSKSAAIMLIYSYVNDLYDRESASKELEAIIPLMTPYNYCTQYMDNMLDLIKVKKRFAL